MSKIELRRIDESNFIDCFNLKLKKEQERFVSHPIRSLAQAYVYYKQCTPFGVVADGEMVGYGMVIYDYDEEEYDLWHVMIDAEQQGKGYGKAAVGLFLNYIRQKPFGDSDLVKLTCHKENLPALRLYESYGFAPTGAEDEDGEIEMALRVYGVFFLYLWFRPLTNKNCGVQ